jgi:regulator of replication initiation timing
MAFEISNCTKRLLKVIESLKSENESLKSENESLSSENESLKSRVEELTKTDYKAIEFRNLPNRV